MINARPGRVAPNGDLTVSYASGDGKVTRTVRVGSRNFTDARQSAAEPTSGSEFSQWWSTFIRGQRAPASRELRPVRFVDLFSSVGGLSLGALEAFAAVGMRGLPLMAADVDQRALQVYKANLRPRFSVPDSVRGMVDFRVSGSGDGARFAYEPVVVDERLAALMGTVDLILAGPPCQGHSSLNNHSRHQDPKNLLYLTVPAAAVALGARHIVIENVPNVVSDKHGVVKTTMALLKQNGYKITSGVLAADRFGWPQTRKRFFLVASRDTAPLPLARMAEEFRRDTLPVSWLLSDLAARPLDDSDVMFSVPQLSGENRMRLDWLFDNDKYDLVDAIRPDCHKAGTTYSATYGRMNNDMPAPTLTGGFLTPGRGRFIHPTERRVLTPREAARVQGFPDWFDFSVDSSEPPLRSEISRWIGNAVPSLLGFVATLAALGGEVAGKADLSHEISAHAS